LRPLAAVAGVAPESQLFRILGITGITSFGPPPTRMNRPGSVTDSFQRAVELEPGNPETVRMAAFSAEMLGRFDEALQLDRRAVELDPLNAESWEFRGETEFSIGQLVEAAADGKKALERLN
jgi:Flp pilus assembly protein TadD